jgi:hypothetical protein
MHYGKAIVRAHGAVAVGVLGSIGWTMLNIYHSLIVTF